MDHLLIFLSALAAGVVNAIAGGGTLISFPTLLWLGRDPILANATSSVALWGGSLTGAIGFRRDLATTRRWLFILVLPSIAGGIAGALLLLETPSALFEKFVPLLILGATILLALQETITKRFLGPRLERATKPWIAAALTIQFLIALYGGYFGAGIGILMLAALGMIGMTDLHQMNGLKNLLAFCIKAVASVYFAFFGAVIWSDAVTMAAGALFGGWLGAKLAKRAGRANVRRGVVVIGLLITIAMVARYF